MTDTSEREIVQERVFEAPLTLVWKAWSDPEILLQWWGPTGFTNTFKQFEFKVGGVWDFTMHGPDGVDYPNYVVYNEIQEPHKIVFTHGEKSEDLDSFQNTVEMKEEAGKTRVTMRLLFPTVERRNLVVEKYGALEGGKQTLAKLAEQLQKMR